jgi:putative NADPH-quinone reductase
VRHADVIRMPRRILIIDGHPDPEPQRFVHALAEAYASGAREAGHEIRTVRLSEMTFDLLRSNRDYRHGEVPEAITDVQNAIARSDHLIVLFPLWLGGMPALLKGLLEQSLRPGFAFVYADGKGLPKKRLKGKSVRIVVTMGMPAFVYRWYFCAHSLKSLERNILRFVGFGPIRTSVVGSVEASAKKRERWLDRIRRYGRAAN